MVIPSGVIVSVIVYVTQITETQTKFNLKIDTQGHMDMLIRLFIDPAPKQINSDYFFFIFLFFVICCQIRQVA